MSSMLARKVGLSVFEKNLKTYEPADPLYEIYVDSKGKTKRRKKELPPGLSKRDAKILRKVKTRAHYLDKGFVICGMRFGWSFVIGIVPVVGDIADAILSYTLVVKKAKQAELPEWLIRRMIMNNMMSIGVGLIPIVGDILLASFKANSRNAALLEEYLRIRGEEFLKAEAKRVEDPTVTKPGAGRESGEKISGKKSGTISGIFGLRKSKSPPESEVESTSTPGSAATVAKVK